MPHTRKLRSFVPAGYLRERISPSFVTPKFYGDALIPAYIFLYMQNLTAAYRHSCS
jgi:hypothetical protein